MSVALLILACARVTDGGTNAMPDSTVSGAVRAVWDRADAVVRRTDPCGAALTCGPTPIPAAVNLPDLRFVRIGTFAPADPVTDLYTGDFVATGQFLRVDLVFDGLVNPPGPMMNNYAPLLHGGSPVIGFVEFDVDTNGATGGNIDAPLLRYNGNVGRFGGLPVGAVFNQRISRDGRDPDNLANTPPLIERSGADFELELSGDDVVSVAHVQGDTDLLFEANEVWVLTGKFFRRARGYEGCAGGGYEPDVALRFAHCGPTSGASGCASSPSLMDRTEQTTVTLVYPLNNMAYAAANALGYEDNDALDFNANSVLEGLIVLGIASAAQLCPPSYEWAELIEPWSTQNPGDYLHPERWRLTALFGTPRPATLVSEGNRIWTDVYPNVVLGDVNGDGYCSTTDARLARAYLSLRDGAAGYDVDGTSNGVVEIVNHGVWFSLYDVDYDGFVDSFDTSFAAQDFGDFDNDGDVDLRDYGALQRCSTTDGTTPAPPYACRDAFDVNGDGSFDHSDFAAFVAALDGFGSNGE